MERQSPESPSTVSDTTAPDPTIASLPRATAWIVPLALAAIVFGVHLGNGFVYDEHAVVVSNPAVNGADPWRTALTRELWYASSGLLGAHQIYYRPAYVAAARLLWAAGGGAAWVFHLASLAVQLLNGTLAFLVLPRLGVGRAVAFAAAAIMLVHPLSGEVVYWGAALPYALVCSCLLLTLLALSFAREASPVSRTSLQAAAIVASGVALLLHEIGIVVPILATADALRAPASTWRSRLRIAWPVWLAVPAYLAIRSLASLPPGKPLDAGVGLARLGRAGRVLAWDLEHLVVPFPLSPLHCLPGRAGTGATLLGACLLAGVAASTVAVLRRRPRETFWLAWVLVPLVPSVTLVFMGGASTQVAERFLFLSVLPALVIQARAAEWVARRLAPRAPSALPGIVAAVAIVVAAALTAGYGRSFANDHAFFSRALAACPEEPVALSALGSEALERGDPASALSLFQRAAESSPGSALAHLNVGHVQKALGRVDEALASLDRAIGLDGSFIAPRLERVEALRSLGRIDDAGAESAAIVARDPANPDGRLNLGTYLFLRGDVERAVEQWKAGLRARPGSCELLFDLAMGYVALSRRDEGRDHALRFLDGCTTGFDGERAQAMRWIAPQDVPSRPAAPAASR